MQTKQNAANGSKVRFGFLSTAQIGRKNWKAIFHSGNGIVAAVASRDPNRAQAFIDGCQGQAGFETKPAAVDGYEALLGSKDIDALYIPLPTALRKEWVIRAAEAGKHVVCEKPCALSSADLEEMLAACRAHRVQFLDGVMFMHHPRMEAMRLALDDASALGTIKRLTSMFSFRGGEDFLRDNIRVHGHLEPAGCLGDLGWYCIRFILWAMKWQMPRQVIGRTLSVSAANRGPQSVPMDFTAELVFDDQTSAGFFCSFLTAFQQWANISGTKGFLRIADFVHTHNDLEATFEVNESVVRVPSNPEGRAAADTVAQQTNLFRNFSKRVLTGQLDESWPEMALKTQRVMDACLASARAGGRPISLDGGSNMPRAAARAS